MVTMDNMDRIKIFPESQYQIMPIQVDQVICEFLLKTIVLSFNHYHLGANTFYFKGEIFTFHICPIPLLPDKCNGMHLSELLDVLV